MLANILTPILQETGKTVVRLSVSTGKAVASHLSKHGSKYIIGLAGAAGSVFAYKKGESDGTKRGTSEQARRDEIKMQDMHDKHEKERQDWREIDKEKDELIDDLLNEK